MRGKVSLAFALGGRFGITPAYAGKRQRLRRYPQGDRDHPRVCGEKYTVLPANMCTVRITPAYAGKSSSAARTLSSGGDHPRVCGEKEQVDIAAEVVPGSPPRMRGKADDMPTKALVNRITPAYAGKRLKRSRSTVPPVAIVPLFPSVCNKPVVSDGSPAGRDALLFLPAENAVPASPAYNLRSL